MSDALNRLRALHTACGCSAGGDEVKSEIMFDGEMACGQKSASDPLTRLRKLAGGAGSRIRWTNQYFKRFFEEKGLREVHWDLTAQDGTPHSIGNEVVLEFINKAPPREQEGIEKMIRRINFANGDVNDYLKHLAGALINNPDFAMRLASMKVASLSLVRMKDGGRQTFSSGGVYAHVWFDLQDARNDFGGRATAGEWQVIISTSSDPMGRNPRGRELARKVFRYVEQKASGMVASAAEDFITQTLGKFRGKVAEGDELFAKGCPDNLDKDECVEWEKNTLFHQNEFKDQGKEASDPLTALHRLARGETSEVRDLALKLDRKGHSHKDADRIRALMNAKDPLRKAQAMAKSITGYEKAYARFHAAEDANFHDGAKVFYDRFSELVGQGGKKADWEPGEKSDPKKSGPDVGTGEGSDVPDGDGNRTKRADRTGTVTVHVRQRTVPRTAGVNLHVALSGDKFLGATDAGDPAAMVGKTRNASTYNVVVAQDVPHKLAEQLVDFGANNPETSAWADEKTAFQAVAPYLPGRAAKKDDEGYDEDPTQKMAATGNYGFTKRMQADVDASSRRIAKQALRIAKHAYGKDARVSDFLGAHSKRGKSLSAKVLLAALAEMGPKLATDKAARLQELREANGTAEKTAAGKPSVLVKFRNSRFNYVTDVGPNVTEEAARKYFVGQKLNVGAYPEEKMERVVDIEYTPAGGRRASGKGAANAQYLNGLPANQKAHMLRTVAKHYGITTAEAYKEVTDPDAEALYEYLAVDRGLAMTVYGDFRNFRLASTSKEAKYGLYGYRSKTSKLGLAACSELRHESGRIGTDLHRRRHAKHGKISEYLKQHCKAADCNYSRLLQAGYPGADMKFAAVAPPSTIDEWISWED
jgi:hypothetical protein